MSALQKSVLHLFFLLKLCRERTSLKNLDMSSIASNGFPHLFLVYRRFHIPNLMVRGLNLLLTAIHLKYTDNI
jgi:hypothetical protein